MRMRTRARQSGFTLIEMLVVLVLVGLIMVWIITISTNSAERERETVAAQYTKRVVDATERYVSDNYAALVASAGPTAPTVLTPATLRSAQYLGAQVPDLNAYGQNTEIRVIEPTPGQLEVLVVTMGGSAIPEGGLRRIARQIGPEGGFVSTSSSTAMTGAYSGWTAPLSTYGAPDGGGRIGAGLFFRDSQSVTDYIYRAAVPGKPELNTMATHLDMGNHNVSNVNNVVANGEVRSAVSRTTGRTYAGEFIEIAGVVAESSTCPTNGTLARLSDGRLASCVSGIWRAPTY